MDNEQNLLEEIRKIHLSKNGIDILITNPTPFPLVGKGEQGVVFQIDDKRCVKVYFDQKEREKEFFSLKLGEDAGISPRVYVVGKYFIVMEYLQAPTLDEYVKRHGLSQELAWCLIKMLDTFENLGFNRFDQSARHIFVFSEEEIKVIDMVYAIQKKTISLPKRLLKDLGVYAQDFIEFAQEISPKWHERWVNHPDFIRVMKKAKGSAH